MSKSKQEYNKYITNSPIWKQKRLECFSRFGKQCSVCGSTSKLHVHHKTYKRFGNECIETDLIPLCQKHHKNLHQYCLKNKLDLWHGSEEYLKYFGVSRVKKIKVKRQKRIRHKHKVKNQKKKFRFKQSKVPKPVITNEQVIEEWKMNLKIYEATKSMTDEELYADMRARVQAKRKRNQPVYN